MSPLARQVRPFVQRSDSSPPGNSASYFVEVWWGSRAFFKCLLLGLLANTNFAVVLMGLVLVLVAGEW